MDLHCSRLALVPIYIKTDFLVWERRSKMICRRAMMGVLVFSMCSIFMGGCGAYKGYPEDINAFIKPYQTNVTAENYVLQPPDEVEVQCSKVTEIHLQTQRVRPDGKISFEGIGEIEVAGKTVGEVTDILERKVAEIYKIDSDNPLAVRVIAPQSKVYYVLGQVIQPGPKVYTGRDTVLSAVAAASPNPMAWEERIVVIRPAEQVGAKPRLFNVNYFHMVERGDTRKNVLLQEGDIVYVPPTILGSIGMVFEEFLGPIGRALSAAWMWTRVSGGSTY